MSRSILRDPLPPNVPQHAHRRGQHFAAWILERAGWKILGQFPDVPRVVLIGAPHSSWWDGVWGLLTVIALGIDVSIMGKQELFRWPLDRLLRWIGVIPIDRAAAHGVVEQMTQGFARRDRLWLGIAPEGTRKRMPKWKTGFWHIARAAGVPILPVAFDYPDKTITIGPPLETSADVDADIGRLRAWYDPFRGKHRGIN